MGETTGEAMTGAAGEARAGTTGEARTGGPGKVRTGTAGEAVVEAIDKGAGPGGRGSDPYVVQSVDKAVGLLFALAKAPGPESIGVTELANELGFTKNATFRLLKTLERHRLVVQDDTRRYRLGSGLLALAAQAQAGLSLVEASGPVLTRLLQETGESVHLASREGLEAVIIDCRESAHAVRLTAELGGRYPLHAGACPQAILAALPSALQERVYSDAAGLPAYTGKTPLDETTLRRTVREIQRRGYAISDEDVDAGARGVGAAILDESGMPVGAISVGGPVSRIPRERLHEYGRLVAAAATEIGARLGGGPGAVESEAGSSEAPVNAKAAVGSGGGPEVVKSGSRGSEPGTGCSEAR